MAWLARSIANSLKLEDEEDDDYYKDPEASSTKQPKPESEQNQTDPQSSSSSPSHSHSSSSTSHTPRGVKEDLSELTKTLTRQFWGVASFLAPPPPPDRPEPGQLSDQPEQHQPLDPDGSDEDMIAGIRSDFAEIGGKFRTGISKLSSNMAVSEITKIASNLLHFGSEEESLDNYAVGNAVGVTEEVVLFAKDIAMHPETWLDFPLPDNEAFEEFDMSDAQQEHALAVERLAPRLAALRIELCPGYMSEGCFWKIYFVLLHPRLSKHDAELLSTIQIVEARAMLSHELQTRANEMAEPNKSGISPSYSKKPADIPCEEPLSMPSGPSLLPSESASDKTSFIKAAPSIDSTDSETEKHLVQNTEMQFIDKSVIEEESAHQSKPQDLPAGPSRILNEKFEDDGDDWLKEENSELVGMAGTSIPLGNDEDVSFSDLEDDDGDVPISYKKVTSGSDSSGKESRDWVQLGRSSTDSVKDINSVGEKHAGSGEVSLPNTETKEPNDWLDVDDIEVM